MRDEFADQRPVFGWALPVSLVVHVAAIVLLIFGLPASFSQPQAERAIKVDLVPPPPEKAEPPPPKPEQQARAEAPPPEKNDAVPQQSPPVVRPVFQFGEKDAGPREARDGDSAEDGSAAPTTQQDQAETEAAAALATATEQAMNGVPQPVAPAARPRQW